MDLNGQQVLRQYGSMVMSYEQLPCLQLWSSTDYTRGDADCPREPSLVDALYSFYAHFEESSTSPCSRLTPPPGELPLKMTTADVRRALQVFTSATSTPTSLLAMTVSQAVFLGTAHHLSEVLMDIFNTPLSPATAPSCLKSTTMGQEWPKG